MPDVNDHVVGDDDAFVKGGDLSNEREISKLRSLDRNGSGCMLVRLCKYCNERV